MNHQLTEPNDLINYNNVTILNMLKSVAKKETYYHFKELIIALNGKITDIQTLKSELSEYYISLYRNIKGRLIQTTFIELEGIKKYLIIGSATNIEVAAQYFKFDTHDIIKKNALHQLKECLLDEEQNKKLDEPIQSIKPTESKNSTNQLKYSSNKLLKFVFDKRKTCKLLPPEIDLDIFYIWIKSIDELNGDYPNSQKLETIRRAVE